MKDAHWRLLVSAVLLIAVGCHDDATYSSRGEADVSVDDDIGAGHENDADIGGDVAAPKQDAAAEVCIECSCSCGKQGPIAYGGCFPTQDDVPDEVVECSADCDDICFPGNNLGCPNISCGGGPCPFGIWPEQDTGCELCVCAPPGSFVETDTAGEIDDFEVEVVGSFYIGGLNRVIVDFVWSFPSQDGRPARETIAVSVGVLVDFFEITEDSVALHFAGWPTEPLELRSAQWTLEEDEGAVASMHIEPTEGFLAIRRSAGDPDRVEGGLYFVGEVTGTANTVRVGAPFSVLIGEL